MGIDVRGRIGGRRDGKWKVEVAPLMLQRRAYRLPQYLLPARDRPIRCYRPMLHHR